MKTVDKIDKAIEQIVSRLVKDYEPERIILYGSFAYGHPDDDSDLDLLILKETGETPLERRVNVRRLVSDPQRSIPFSPLVLTPDELHSRLMAEDPFYEEIMRRGKVLYAQN